MYQFSKSSQQKLDSCHPDLQRLFNEVILTYDCTVLFGYRTPAEQQTLYNEGKSKLAAGMSKHNLVPAHAIDVSPYPIDWKNTKRFYHFAGFVQATAGQMGITLRWGGDWDRDRDLDDQSFMDLVHFEL